MTTLPIQKIILYKHGVGYFERRGSVDGRQVRLSFPRAAMDDVLKSLIALDLGTGAVLSVDFETPEDRAQLLAKGSIHLSPTHSMLDLLRDLRGRQVRCSLNAWYAEDDDDDDQYNYLYDGFDNGDGSDEDDEDDDDSDEDDEDDDDSESAVLEGVVIGVEYEDREQLKRAMLTLYQPADRRVHFLPVADIQHLELLDSAAAADLNYFLRASQNEEDRRSATLHLSDGDHDLLVGYIAPAPAWRVSYRMLVEMPDPPAPDAPPDQRSVLLQGWGLFDNQLEEDLQDVRLTLVAGMPVSFRYRLYQPHTPERPLIQDEERTVGSPVFFEAAPPPAPRAQTESRARSAGGQAMLAAAAPAEADAMELEDTNELGFALSGDVLEQSVQAASSGSERGALFAYEVTHPVSVGRGQSAMVPILSRRLPCRRELLYNGRKLPKHPVASLRLDNTTGFTLERGPVTVLEDGAYAGEAVVPFTRAGSEVIVPFAVELGISVDEQPKHERRLTSMRLRDDYLLIEEYELWHTHYTLTSTLDRPVDVLIEHNRRGGYEITNTLEPVESGASFARWSVTCAASSRTVFVVHERRQRSRREQVRSMTGDQLQAYLREQVLDDTTIQKLATVMLLYRQIEETNGKMKVVERERDKLYKQQRHIQGNLGPLGRDGEEGALRMRYVGELNRLEDRLKELNEEEQQLRQQIQSLEQQAWVELGKAGEK